MLQSFVNINADNTTVYQCASKTLDDQRLAADLTAELVITASGKIAVTANASKTKLVQSTLIGH